jgi:hypothetical protein
VASATPSLPPLPVLPLLLWETPPGLELILAQEGVPFVRVQDRHPLAFRGGRFVLYDGRRAGSARLGALLSPRHTALDVDAIRRQEGADLLGEVLDTRAAPATWRIAGFDLTERVARRDKAALRRRVVGRLRDAVTRAGGLWARLAPFPFPYRSAFNFRADLDEPCPDDYARFARARRPLLDCTTHFVSTSAYGDQPKVLANLKGLDVQSHGHYHVVYRDREANRRNLHRAHDVLTRAGIHPSAFAAPEGRWNVGLDEVVEGLGYHYASEFHLGHDDLPFYPWRAGRFSTVLQVPIHPVCEGLFLEAGAIDGRVIAAHLARVVRSRVEAGEPAFIYGHPERRLARFPGILATLAEEVARHDLLWRVTLTEFARWWRWRSQRRWSLVPKADGRLEVQFDEWDEHYRLGLEIQRGPHAALLPVTGPRMALGLDALAYERRSVRVDLPAPIAARRPLGLGWKAAVRSALDWETVTPVEDLPVDSLAALLKKRLRLWRERGAGPGKRGGR